MAVAMGLGFCLLALWAAVYQYQWVARRIGWFIATLGCALLALLFATRLMPPGWIYRLLGLCAAGGAFALALRWLRRRAHPIPRRLELLASTVWTCLLLAWVLNLSLFLIVLWVAVSAETMRYYYRVMVLGRDPYP